MATKKKVLGTIFGLAAGSIATCAAWSYAPEMFSQDRLTQYGEIPSWLSRFGFTALMGATVGLATGILFGEGRSPKP
jgi:hypothetical protein